MQGRTTRAKRTGIIAAMLAVVGLAVLLLSQLRAGDGHDGIDRNVPAATTGAGKNSLQP
jgi:hypothetical protein